MKLKKPIKGFKFIQEDMKSKNGNMKWEFGKWFKHNGNIDLCNSGFHACRTPQQATEYIYGNRFCLVEARGEFKEDNEKFVCTEMKIVKEILPQESVKVFRKYKKPLDVRKIEKELGNIPTKDKVVSLLKRIDKINWFTPQEPNKVKIKLKVDSVLKAFNLDFSCDIQFNKLNTKKDWASAWDSARDSAWDSAWASARDSARDSARASAWASALDLARDSAWDSSRASEFEVVADLMNKKGYKKNPFKELLSLWEMGLYPCGILKDKKFHIYYVPKEAKK